jgi:hypothetical protein
MYSNKMQGGHFYPAKLIHTVPFRRHQDSVLLPHKGANRKAARHMPGPKSWDGAKRRLKRPRTDGAAKALEQNVGKIVCGGKAARRPDGVERPQQPMRKLKVVRNDHEKRLRALNKLLREIEALQERAATGDELDAQQSAKCSRLDVVLSEMEALISTADAPPAPTAGIAKPKRKKEKQLPPWVKKKPGKVR